MSRPLRIYLAGASRELDRVLPMVERLERSGLVVLHSRWWDAVQAHGVGNDHALTREQQAGYADADLEGVRDAELVWVLWPEARSVGAALEYGFALASCIHTVVTGPTAHECIFTAKANYRDADDWAGLHEVLRVAAERKLPDTLPAPPMAEEVVS